MAAAQADGGQGSVGDAFQHRVCATQPGEGIGYATARYGAGRCALKGVGRDATQLVAALLDRVEGKARTRA